MPHEVKNLSLDQRVTIIENWQKWLMRAATVSLAGILAFAFWLGTISAKVSSSEQTINKVYSAVSEDPNSLLVRTSVMEHRLTGVENRLTSVEDRLTSVEHRLTSVEHELASVNNRLTAVEGKLTSMDAKLNDVLTRLGASRKNR
jgi:uncharacterized coiled-coil protein SlyX